MLATLALALVLQDPLPLDREVLRPRFPASPWQALEPAPERVEDPTEGLATVFLSGDRDAWKSSDIAAPYLRARPLPDRWSLGDFRDELREVMDSLERSTRFDRGNGPLLRARLLAELDWTMRDVEARVARAGEESEIDLDAVHGDDLLSDRFQAEQWTLDHEGASYSSDVVFFSSTDTQVILALDLVDPDPGALLAPEPFADFATIEQAIEFRAACARVVEMIAIAILPGLERAAARLASIDAGWTNYLEHGFSQYPWESWANGRLTSFSWTRPPKDQWVLLHPELGFVFDTRSSRSAEVTTALLLHTAGYVRYFGDEREWFTGLSATVSITDDSSYGMGFGPTLHFGHTKLASRVPHVSVGVLWQDFEVGGTEPVLAATLDLWRLVDRGSDALYEARLLQR